MHLMKRHSVWGVGMEDFGFLCARGFCGDSHIFLCGYGMGMRIEIQSNANGGSCLPRNTHRPVSILSCAVVAHSSMYGNSQGNVSFTHHR